MAAVARTAVRVVERITGARLGRARARYHPSLMMGHTTDRHTSSSRAVQPTALRGAATGAVSPPDAAATALPPPGWRAG